MTPPIFRVDLDRPPEERWRGIERYRDAAVELLAYYVRDIGGVELFGDLLAAYRDAYVAPEYAREMSDLAARLDRSEAEVLLGNLYYDAIKHFIGCTAFAVDTRDGPLHARNLDWGTVNQMLSRHTLLVEYWRGGEPRFTVVGWPGFAGALSGVAPGRFAVTLNAVLGEDPPGLAPPMTFLIRDVLDTALDYDEALARLRDTPVTSDSLLLLTGTRRGEMAVIERSPSRAAVREAEDGVVVVTNDYRALPAPGASGPATVLAETSCGRFDRATSLLAGRRPASGSDCFAILLDDEVRMNITMQSMVLHARSGAIQLRLRS